MLRCWLGTEKHCCRRWPLWKSAKRHLKQRFFMRGSVQQMRLRHFKHLNKECRWNSRTATKWSGRELLSCATKRVQKICLKLIIWKFERWDCHRLSDFAWWKRYSGGRTGDFAPCVHVKSFGNSELGEAVGQYATAITAWSGCKGETQGVKGSRDSATSKGERFLLNSEQWIAWIAEILRLFYFL